MVGTANVDWNAVPAHRRYAAGVEHRTAGRRDLLRFAVVERSQQPRRRHETGIGGEHAGYVGPDLETSRRQTTRDIGGRRVGSSSAEQHGVAGGVTRDETLRENDTRHGGKAGAQRRIRLCTTLCTEDACARGKLAPRLALQHGSRIDPLHVQPKRA